jgi:hypothetical protein
LLPSASNSTPRSRWPSVRTPGLSSARPFSVRWISISIFSGVCTAVVIPAFADDTAVNTQPVRLSRHGGVTRIA